MLHQHCQDQEKLNAEFPPQQLNVLGYGYIGARTDTTQQTQHLSGYTWQERVATFNP